MVFLLLCLLAPLVAAYPSAANQEFVARRYHALGAPSVDEPVHLTFALKQRNVDKLEALVEEISNPRSAAYGNTMSALDLRALLAPLPEHAQLVRAFVDGPLAAQRVDTVLTGDFLDVTSTVAAVERAFNVKMQWFRHKHSGRRALRTLDTPQLPSDVAAHVELITGLVDFFDSKKERRGSMLRDNLQAPLAANNAPDILPIRGSSQRLELQIMVFAENGTPMTTLNPSDVLRISILSMEGEHETVDVSVSSQHCKIVTGGRAGAGAVCMTQALLSVPYSRVKITAEVVYANGNKSQVGQYKVEGTMAGWVDPHVIYDLYGIPRSFSGTAPRNSQAVVAFEEQYISRNDLQSFLESNGLNYNASKVHIVGPNDPTKPGGESTLDISYITAVGRDIDTYFLSFCGPGPAKGPCGAYIMTWAMWVANQTAPPLVTSISYGDTESGYFNKFGSFSYIDRMNTELMKMAARSLTVFAGSGDAGASNVGEAGNDISPTDPDCTQRPFFPSDSPYVVSVSATLLTTRTTKFCANSTVGNGAGGLVGVQCNRLGEAIVSMSTSGTYWTTGGGFSRHFSTPAFQKKAVAGYLRKVAGGNLPKFNSGGRAYADLSALGFNLNMVLGGQVTPVGGTSASGPVLAGIFSLLNDIQLRRGLPPLGRPHYWLYDTLANTPGAFTDMTFGNNNDGDWQKKGSVYPSFCPVGFPVVPGFDAVSGFGSINWPVLVENLP